MIDLMWITMLISCVEPVYNSRAYAQFVHALTSLRILLWGQADTCAVFVQPTPTIFPHPLVSSNACVKAFYTFTHSVHKTYYHYHYICNIFINRKEAL